jgi:hypothetical protein
MPFVKCKDCGDEGHVAWDCSKPKRVVVEAATKTYRARHKTSGGHKGGRPRKYADSVERYRAHRQRKRAALSLRGAS